MLIEFCCHVDRFYGKIKADPVDHEQKTLETIRRNTEGLLGEYLTDFHYITVA